VHTKGESKGWLKAARYKIYINGNKVFDHVAMGDRGNIDKDESFALRDHVSALTAKSPQDTTYNMSPRGLSTTEDAPSLPDMKSGQNSSIDSPMFTDAVEKSKTLPKQKAFDRATELVKRA
jgi:hypothetical protein